MMERYKVTKNLGVKIMALAFAIFLWFIVVNVDDPVESSTYRGIPVTIQNTEIVTNKGKTYTITDDVQTVNVVVKAKRSILSKISSGNIIATADMSEMQFESLIPISITILGYEGRYSAESTPGNLRVTIEEQTKKSFPLTVSTTGTARDGYVVDTSKMTTNPEKITIKGSKSVVSSVDKVVAKVDISGISRSGELAADLVYYDKNGNVINSALLTDNIGDDGVYVYVTILNTKMVEIKVDLTGAPSNGYVYTEVLWEPTRIQVCATQEVLDTITQITIPYQALEVTAEPGKVEKTVDLTPYLPEGVQLVDETANNVVVTVTIEQEGKRTVEIPLESIQIKNLEEDFKVSFESTEDLVLEFTGSKEQLNLLDVTEAISIDLKGRTKAGTYEAVVDVDLDGVTGVTLIQNPVVKVVLTKKES
jgi:YbbR domain-containing protein